MARLGLQGDIAIDRVDHDILQGQLAEERRIREAVICLVVR
jgi:hypothetical protein